MLLVEAGANLIAKNEKYGTAFQWAKANEQIEIASYLKLKGGDYEQPSGKLRSTKTKAKDQQSNERKIQTKEANGKQK